MDYAGFLTEVRVLICDEVAWNISCMRLNAGLLGVRRDGGCSRNQALIEATRDLDFTAGAHRWGECKLALTGMRLARGCPAILRRATREYCRCAGLQRESEARIRENEEPEQDSSQDHCISPGSHDVENLHNRCAKCKWLILRPAKIGGLSNLIIAEQVWESLMRRSPSRPGIAFRSQFR
jgi:hypothetical protein